ncbi:MAG: hydrogenase maturation nickel metallochaperone HypA [Gemmatimonadetes bacterium]|nr:hydrogenase maturation nickel metallochaperone HypA [Gemmatimonadota bacterium]
MHELSVALEICRIVEAHVPADRLGDVVEVAVEVGADAGIEPASLEFCLEALLSLPPFGRARSVLTRLPGDVLRVAHLELEEPDVASRTEVRRAG